MNRLAEAMSPYLQQHAHNPVDWRPWGPQALAEARRRDVPLLISIGYAACHWCHVMAHESFDDDEVAELVNASTVPVKVDREERPDVDAVYMQATLAMTGQGGWPMTVFANAEGEPFFAGTYFPKTHFVRLVEAVNDAWRNRRSDVLSQGNAVVEACAAAGPRLADVTQACPIGGPCPPTSPVPMAELDAAVDAIGELFDPVNGGFGGAPKFPTQPVLSFLAARDRPDSVEVLKVTARRMARGGIYDQLGGGFARYSVDSTWTVPHFEKMLYDNAGLLTVYARLGATLVDDPVDAELCAFVASETAGFMLSELSTSEGGFASALDADTDGVEGATYVWTPGQLREVLGEDDGAWAAELFGVTPQGTFEHGSSVLQLPADADDRERARDVRARLLRARRQRPQPSRDDKVVAAWNGMAVSALTAYARHSDAPEAEAAAERAARLLADRHMVDGRLRRVSRDGVVGEAPGILEDYGAVAQAFIDRYGATKESEWLDHARLLVDAIVEHFTTEEGGFYDTADDAETLVNRPADPTDGPTPSGWALAAGALLAFSEASGEESYKDDAWRAVATAAPVVADHPRFAAGLATVALRMVVGDDHRT